MTVRSIARPSSLVVCVGMLAAVFVLSEQGPQASAADKPAAGPSHQVIACYFHRTVRCPTCRRISVYIEEAVQTGFATEVQAGSVKMMMIDF